jgi:hypothetical protein
MWPRDGCPDLSSSGATDPECSKWPERGIFALRDQATKGLCIAICMRSCTVIGASKSADFGDDTSLIGYRPVPGPAFDVYIELWHTLGLRHRKAYRAQSGNDISQASYSKYLC